VSNQAGMVLPVTSPAIDRRSASWVTRPGVDAASVYFYRQSDGALFKSAPDDARSAPVSTIFSSSRFVGRAPLKAYLDITNIYNNANVEVNQPNYDFTRRATLTWLPIIPSFGIRAEF